MPRIRSLKPEIASDAKLASVSIEARYTFVLMITQSDDAGLLPGAHRQILGTLYPLNEIVTVPTLLSWIEELVGIGLVRWRSTRDNTPVLQLINWSKHQRIDNAGRSQLGALLAESPDDLDNADVRGDSRRTAAKNDTETVNPQSALSAIRGESPLGTPTTDLGSPIPDHQVAVDTLDRAAIAFSVAANKGLAEHVDPARRQPIARIIATSGKSHEAAKLILQAGVPIAFAESAIYELARSNSADGEVKTLKYFAGATIRRWEEQQETERASNGNKPSPRSRRNGSRPTAPDYASNATDSMEKVRWAK